MMTVFDEDDDDNGDDCEDDNGKGTCGRCWLIKVIICESDCNDGYGGLFIDEGMVMMEIM